MAGQGLGGAFGAGGLAVAIFQAHQLGKGRVAKLAAHFQLAVIKSGIIVAGGSLDNVMLRLEGLKDHLPAQAAAPGPPGHLGEHLEGALGGAQVGQAEAHIGQHHAHQGHQRQIQALGDHLRAHQHVGALAGKLVQDQVMGAFLASGFIIPAQGAGLREERLHLGLNLLGAGAVMADARPFAGRAGFGRLALVAAVMAGQQGGGRAGG